MKTLADFKRTIAVGQTWHAFHHPFNKDMGTRVVSKVRSSDFAFLAADGRDSWCRFPKAADLKITEDGAVQIYEGGELVLTYRKVDGNEWTHDKTKCPSADGPCPGCRP